jgi:hypothetical protein
MPVIVVEDGTCRPTSLAFYRIGDCPDQRVSDGGAAEFAVTPPMFLRAAVLSASKAFWRTPVASGFPNPCIPGQDLLFIF